MFGLFRVGAHHKPQKRFQHKNSVCNSQQMKVLQQMLKKKRTSKLDIGHNKASKCWTQWRRGIKAKKSHKWKSWTFTQNVNEGGVNQGRKPELIDGTKPNYMCKNLQMAIHTLLNKIPNTRENGPNALGQTNKDFFDKLSLLIKGMKG